MFPTRNLITSFAAPMRIIIFLLHLCFLLLTGDSYTHAATHRDGISYTLAKHIGENINAVPDRYLTPDAGTDTEITYIVGDDVEEEDSDNFPASKDKLSAARHPVYTYTPSYPGILNYLCNSCIVPRPFFGQVADKCILQRVLRI